MSMNINVDISTLVLNSVQNQLQSNVCMLGKPEVIGIRMGLGIKIDNILGLSGITSFSEYTEKVIEKSKEGACLINQLSSNSIALSTANFGLTVDTLVNLVNSKAFALDMCQFLRIVCGSVTSSCITTERKFWRIQQFDLNGDIEIKAICLEVRYSDNGNTDGLLGSLVDGRESNDLVLKIDVLQYGVPGEVVN